jgi:hypothetical protein
MAGSREKVLVSLAPDVIALIDERAKWHRMNRSQYIAARCLGLLGDPGDKNDEDELKKADLGGPT